MTDAGAVLCCPDKFRGSLTAGEAADALAAGVERVGRPAVRLPLADGGEGTLVRVEAEADAGKLFGLGGPLLRKAVERKARSDFARLKALLEPDA